MSWLIAALGEMIVLLILIGLGRTLYAEKFGGVVYPMKLKLMAPGIYFLIQHWRLIERFPGYAVKAHMNLVLLHGAKAAQEITPLFVIHTLSLSYLSLMIGTIFSALAEEEAIFALCLFIAVVMPLLTLRRLTDQVQQRKRSMIMELPEVLNKMILLVNAGETAQAAFIRAVDARFLQKDSALRSELALTVRELQMNVSFAKALEQFSRRCGLQEVSMLTTTLTLNYKRGGDELVLALRALAKELWDRRKAVSRTLGEEASSKLVFPMVVIFLVVMAIVGAPALMMMNQ